MDSLIAEQVQEYQRIRSGIHVSMIGTTRGGKTTLATGNGDRNRGLLRHFEDALILDTTGDPGSISEYGKPLNRVGAIHGHRRLTVTDMTTKSKEKVHKAIQKAVRQGHIAIYADEVRQLADKKYFGLGPTLDYLWLFTAKKGVSLIGGTQAPLFVPGAFYDQAKMHFLFHIRDEYRMKRLAEIGGDTKLLKQVIPQLERFEFAHVTMDGEVYISKFDLKPQRQQKRVTVEREKRLTVTRA